MIFQWLWSVFQRHPKGSHVLHGSSLLAAADILTPKGPGKGPLQKPWLMRFEGNFANHPFSWEWNGIIIPSDFHSLTPWFFRGVGRLKPPTSYLFLIIINHIITISINHILTVDYQPMVGWNHQADNHYWVFYPQGLTIKHSGKNKKGDRIEKKQLNSWEIMEL